MPIRLLSTDFDGTLIGHHADARTVRSLSGALTGLRRQGAVWAVNTGRQLWFALEGLEQAALPHDPEFVLTSEKDIYRRIEEGSWEAFGDWNAQTERHSTARPMWLRRSRPWSRRAMGSSCCMKMNASPA